MRTGRGVQSGIERRAARFASGPQPVRATTDRWVGGSAAALAGGALGTALITAMSATARALGLMTLDFGRVIGTAFRRDAPSTRAVGWSVFAANGLLLAFGYRAVFRVARVAPDFRAGLVLGAAHFGAAIAGLAVAPHLHPRPRDAGLKPLRPAAYGPMTVPGMLIGHVVYGAIVGRALKRDPLLIPRESTAVSRA